jgi:hypothetical protein
MGGQHVLALVDARPAAALDEERGDRVLPGRDVAVPLARRDARFVEVKIHGVTHRTASADSVVLDALASLPGSGP